VTGADRINSKSSTLAIDTRGLTSQMFTALKSHFISIFTEYFSANIPGRTREERRQNSDQRPDSK
jgi:hypothetical protein